MCCTGESLQGFSCNCAGGRLRFKNFHGLRVHAGVVHKHRTANGFLNGFCAVILTPAMSQSRVPISDDGERLAPLPAQQPLAEDDGEDEAPELSQDSDSESEPGDNDSDRDTWSAMFTDAWRGVMHSETTEKQMAAWESLNSRMAQMKEREGGSRQVPAQNVKAAPRKPGLDDPKLVPNPHETAFLRNASHLSENAVNEWLALLHDDSFTGTGPDRPTLRWNSAKTMKAFLKRSGARLGEIGVNSTTIPIGESMYCAI